MSAPIFRDFMIAALKNVPATPFRTPPGVQLYRVNPSTGLPPGPGEPAIWEPFKIGTNPPTNRNFALVWSAAHEGQQGQTSAPGDAAAAGAMLPGTVVSGAVVPGIVAPVTAQDNGTAPVQRDAPRSGTGGLY